ncbi:MAG: hypothetical protein KJZ54_02630 [Phycisphaerales bacterium]|nr:hypothetical protein [Phycisphaerales bacterium]
MDPKPRPNEERYRRIIRRMTPAQRIEKAGELSDMTKELALAGLRQRYPDLDELALRRRLLELRTRWARSTS